jgi:hypothetical protein
MTALERRVGQEAKAVTRQEVVMKAVLGRISWLQASDILGITPRQMRRVERVVRNDNVVVFERLLLQLPEPRARAHYVRCPVLVHRFLDENLGVSFQGRLIARFDAKGGPRPLRSPATAAA